ncbi:helix-turn-helix domain-containing protein [Streptomyces zingiberis]|uniref:helix-turn-helix domain-containing protein n=1 Tax=Streptomyces zingiberis TaxID=2053010 RepID=UPI001F114D50|nr:helix-turn-helix transcriptional regulator [Streptomyces zingiberis]
MPIWGVEETMPFMARGGSGTGTGTGTDAAAARLARQAAAALAGELSARGLSRAELAALMGVSPGRVSQILSGDANLTVRSLASAAAAMGATVEIRFHEPERPCPSPGPAGPAHAAGPAADRPAVRDLPVAPDPAADAASPIAPVAPAAPAPPGSTAPPGFPGGPEGPGGPDPSTPRDGRSGLRGGVVRSRF